MVLSNQDAALCASISVVRRTRVGFDRPPEVQAVSMCRIGWKAEWPVWRAKQHNRPLVQAQAYTDLPLC